jgi:predicted O-methyltransferase YrrM
MSQARWTEVDEYFGDKLLQKDPVLDGALEASKAAGLPPINVSPTQGKFLMLLARMLQARRILEIGTLAGYSTIWLARALSADGSLVTLEADPKHAEVARANFKRAGLDSIIDLRLGAALDSLPKIETENRGPFDLVFIDADKRNNPGYLTWALKLSRPGSVVVVDNVVRDGAVVDTSNNDANLQGIRRMNEMIAAEPRLDATAIQTVGIKGYDGFVIALVKSAAAF